jgi:hypothetical protein
MAEYKCIFGLPPDVISDKYNIDFKYVKLSESDSARLQFTKLHYSLPLKYDKLRLSIQLGQKSKLYKLLESLDDMIPRLAYENRKIWFSEDLWDNELDIFQTNYHKLLQLSDENESNYANLGFNLFFRYNNLTVEIYDHNNKIIKDQVKIIQELGFGDYLLSGLFQIKSIWFNNEAYGISLELLQLKMIPSEVFTDSDLTYI